MGDTFQAGSWSVDMEVNLFHAMRSHKPVGVNRHFHMVFIHDKLCNPASKKLTAKNVWEHLSTMYDLQALNESEILPFPNKPVDFTLPEEDYGQLHKFEYPRTQTASSVVPAIEENKEVKSEGQAKGSKVSKSDSKTSLPVKSESKSIVPSENKPSQSSKLESKSVVSTSSKGEGKGGGKIGHTVSGQIVSSSDPSPKRIKRTRHNQSATSSPASDTSASKRRR